MQKVLFPLLILGFVLFSFVPTFYEISVESKMRPERYFELVHNFPTDFNFYRSRIREGMDGQWLATEKYTSEPHAGSLIHIFYVLLGQLGRFNRVPYWLSQDVYHVTRFILGIVFLSVVAAIARATFVRFGWQVMAFLLAVTASSWPILVEQFDGWRFGGYMPWWSVMDSLQRITFIPHLMVGQTLIAVLLFLFSSDAVIARRGNILFLGFLTIILGIVFPPGYVFVGAATVVMIGIEFIWNFHTYKKNFKQFLLTRVLPRVSVLAIGLPTLVYLQYMTSFYPWKRLAEFDIVKPLPYDALEYFRAVGPMLPLGVIGLVIALCKKQKTMLLATSWILSWGLLLYVFKFIPQQSPLRFSQMIPHVPLALLATFALTTSGAFFARLAIRQKTRKPILFHAFSLLQALLLAMPALLVVLFLFHMYSSWLWQRDFVDHKMRAQYPLVPTGSYVMYPLKDFMNAMWWIKDNTPSDAVILSETTAGNYIPVYAGQRVYVGHANTVKAEEKEIFVHAFFSGTMKPNEAKDFMVENNLQYVFFGPQEREERNGNDLDNSYKFLKEIYKNDYVAVYSL